MDQPLFGEQRKEAQVLQYVVIFIVVGFTAATVVSGAVKGIADPQKFALVATVVVTFVNLAVLYRWYSDKEDRLHPKFKYLMAGFVALMLLTNSTAMVFIMSKPAPCPTQPICNGGLILQGTGSDNKPTYNCLGISNLPICLNTSTGGGCIKMNGYGGQCYQNCSQADTFDMDAIEIGNMLRGFARIDFELQSLQETPQLEPQPPKHKKHVELP